MVSVDLNHAQSSGVEGTGYCEKGRTAEEQGMVPAGRERDSDTSVHSQLERSVPRNCSEAWEAEQGDVLMLH